MPIDLEVPHEWEEDAGRETCAFCQYKRPLSRGAPDEICLGKIDYGLVRDEYRQILVIYKVGFYGGRPIFEDMRNTEVLDDFFNLSSIVQNLLMGETLYFLRPGLGKDWEFTSHITNKTFPYKFELSRCLIKIYL